MLPDLVGYYDILDGYTYLSSLAHIIEYHELVTSYLALPYGAVDPFNMRTRE